MGRQAQKRFDDYRVVIDAVEGDVTILLPNGESVIVQYRCEHETIDICLSDTKVASVHPDDDLGKPKKHKSGLGFIAKQIVLC